MAIWQMCLRGETVRGFYFNTLIKSAIAELV